MVEKREKERICVSLGGTNLEYFKLSLGNMTNIVLMIMVLVC